MDKETLSNYGWIVICVLVLAVMMALATPFGKFVGDGFKSTYEGLYNTMTKGLTIIQTDSTTAKEPALNPTGTIPEGGTYYVNIRGEWDDEQQKFIYSYDDKLEAGEQFPVLQRGDIYSYGNYEYCYGYSYCVPDETWGYIDGCGSEYDGWSVRCINDVAMPGVILESINGGSVTALHDTFKNCINVESVTLPSNVVVLENAFVGCTAFHTLDMSSVNIETIQRGMFIDCINLENVILPSSIKCIDDYAFQDCTALKSITIPDNTDIIGYRTFYNCTSLENIIFEGTKEQWNAISLDDNWNECCLEITVTCTDGTITIPAWSY